MHNERRNAANQITIFSFVIVSICECLANGVLLIFCSSLFQSLRFASGFSFFVCMFFRLLLIMSFRLKHFVVDFKLKALSIRVRVLFFLSILTVRHDRNCNFNILTFRAFDRHFTSSSLLCTRGHTHVLHWNWRTPTLTSFKSNKRAAHFNCWSAPRVSPLIADFYSTLTLSYHKRELFCVRSPSSCVNKIQKKKK